MTIDYMSRIPQPDLGQSLLSGVQAGSAIRGIRDQRAAQAEAERQNQQFSVDLQNALSNGADPKTWAAMTAKYPQMREAFKQSWDMLNDDQKDAEFGAGVRVYSALQNKRPDIALSTIDEHIEAMDNSGQDTSELRGIRDQIELDPNGAVGYLGLVLSASDPDRWGKVTAAQQEAALAPAKLTEAQAKAQKAATDAKFAESKAVQDLTNGGWDIMKLQNDISLGRENARIAAMNAALAKESNELKRKELQQKIDAANLERDEKVRTKAAEIASARGGIDNSLNTIDRLIKNPELDNILGSVEGSSFYPSTLAGLVSPFSDADQRADAIADLETIQSQSFLNNLMEAKAKGATFGALTEKEGDRLIGYVQSLKTKQSEKQFRSNMTEIQRLLLKSRKNLSDRYGVPDFTPDRPNLQPPAEAPAGDIPLPSTQGFRVIGVER